MKSKLLLFLTVPLFWSCIDNFDPDNLDNFQYNGEWAIPVINAKLELNNIVANDSNFTVDPDGGLRIIFEDPSLFIIETAELVKVPNQDPQLLSLPSDAPPFFINTELGTLAGAKLKNVTVMSGYFNWKFYNPTSILATVEFAVLNATLNGDTAKFVLSSTGLGENTGMIDISSLDFDFTVGSTGYNALQYRMKILNNGGAPTGTIYDLEVQLTDVVVEDAIGYFGNRNINIPAGVIDPQISGFENFLNGLILANPTIKLSVAGNVGLPIEFRPNMDGVDKNGNVVELNLLPQNYYGPTQPGNWDTSIIVIDKNTSDIVDFIANVPSSIIYSGELELNPLGETGTDNFITHDGQVVFGLILDLPLELKTQDLLLEQWIYDFDLGIDEDEVDFVEKLDLFFKVTNGFPFDSDLELLFVDSVSNIALDSVKIELFNSAIVDAQGRVTEPTVSRTEVHFTQGNIQNLIKANKLRIRLRLNSYNNGSQVVKLYSDYNVEIAVGVGVKLNFGLND